MPKGQHPNSRKNLTDKYHFTVETASAMGKKGAEKSNEVQRKAKTFAEELRLLLEVEIANNKGQMVTTRKAISTALVKKALQGDKGAYEQIRDTVGEKPTEKVEQMVITPEVDFEKLAQLRKALRDERGED